MAVSVVLGAPALVAALRLYRTRLCVPGCGRARSPGRAIVLRCVRAATATTLAEPIGPASNNPAQGIIPVALFHRRFGSEDERPARARRATREGAPRQGMEGVGSKGHSCNCDLRGRELVEEETSVQMRVASAPAQGTPAAASGVSPTKMSGRGLWGRLRGIVSGEELLTLINQAVVSAASFLTTITIARFPTPSELGLYSI